MNNINEMIRASLEATVDEMFKTNIKETKTNYEKGKKNMNRKSNELNETEILEQVNANIPEYLKSGSEEDRARALKEATKELDNLVGLTEVKTQVKKLAALAKCNVWQKEAGIDANSVCYHMVFTGGPGTGKTTVARLMAKIFYGYGLMSTGKMISVTAADLIGQHIGETAPKTREKCISAYDGVLFVDEAYTLNDAVGSSKGFGKEAIGELLQQMENNRDRLIVIIAGYDKEMKEFMDMNTGLASRFSNTLHFNDYSYDELCEVLAGLFTKAEWTIKNRKTLNMIFNRVKNIYENRDEHFGNAREMRKLFEDIQLNHCMRIAEEYDTNPGKDVLLRITEADINN